VASCIFCDEQFGPGRKRSQEHAAPKWCAKLVPDQGPAQHDVVVEEADGTTIENNGLRDPFTTVAGDVCEPCNTGWMHELEDSCEVLLGHLIQGHARKIRFWRQMLAATWAVKTALVWESVYPRLRTIPPDVFHTLHRTQRAEARQQVWLGQFAGAEPYSFRRGAGHVIDAEGSDNPDGAHGYLVALTVGQLALIVYGHVMPVPAYRTLPSEFESKLVHIWRPTLEVAYWPPPETLTETDLDLIVTSLGPFESTA
jgi:hypothetical protein